MMNRLFPGLAIALAALTVALTGCTGGEENQEEAFSEEDALRKSLTEIEAAFEEGDYDRIYDDFISADCREVFPREAFTALQREAPPYSLTARRARGEGAPYTVNFSEPEMIDIVGDSATFEIPFFFPEDQETEGFLQFFVSEDGQWRDSECFF